MRLVGELSPALNVPITILVHESLSIALIHYAFLVLAEVRLRALT